MLLTIQRNEPCGVAVLVARQPERDRRVDGAGGRGPARSRRPSAAQAALGVQPLEEDAEEEHDEDRRGQVALHALQVVVEARARPGSPGSRRARSAPSRWSRRGRSRPAGACVAPGPQLLVEVHREERRAGVERAGERAHQRREQAGDHQAAHADRQHVLHHQREGRLGLCVHDLAVGVDQALLQRRDLAASWPARSRSCPG